MALLLKDGRVIDDDWIMASDDLDSLPVGGNFLLSYSQWQQFADQLEQRNENMGIWLQGDTDIEAIIEPLLDLPVIAIKFPKFVDGRGFSLARLLRERFHYAGELIAIGDIMRDQLYLLRHCGFNAFQFDAGVDPEQAAQSLLDFSNSYQASTEQPIPLFRRR